MKIAVISDLHRGSGKRVDNFGLQNEEKLCRFLTHVDEEYDFLYVIGDRDELWQGPGWTEKSRYKKICQRYYQSEEAFAELRAKNKIQTIPGNHDWLLQSKYNLPSIVTINQDGFKVILTHGHMFDDFYNSRKMAFIGRLGTEFWGIVETMAGTEKTASVALKIEGYVHNLLAKFKKRPSDKSEKEKDAYVEKAIVYAIQHNAGAIIIGHTHRPQIVKRKNGKKTILFADSGRWVDGEANYLIIDTKKQYIRNEVWT